MPVSGNSASDGAIKVAPLRALPVAKQRVSTAPVRLLDQNSRRAWFTVYNNSTQSLYLDFDQRVGSEQFWVKLPPGTFFEPLFNCGDQLWGAWEAADLEGEAMLREFQPRA